MKTRPIGSLRVTIVGLGTNNFGMGMAAEDVAPVVNAALDAGINFIDTADSYGASEERLGAALGPRRDDILIATKFGSPVRGEPDTGGARPDYVRRAVDASLKRLGTDRIDLYQIHRPDPETPIADTLGALDEIVAAGKVREIGCSNFSAAQLREAEQAAGNGPRFLSVQNNFNLLNRADEEELLPLCEELGVTYLPYFPLASGLLTGKYQRGQAPPEGTRLERWGERAAGMLTEQAFDQIDALTNWAAQHGHSILDLAFAWLLAKKPVASVIAGATRAEQVKANVAAADWELSPEQVTEVEGLLRDVTVADRIEVARAGDNRYAVTVQSAAGKTVHQVAVPPRLLRDLGVGPDDGAHLVQISFEFLLEREPPSSILPSFDLDVIGRYFPEYIGAMRARVAPAGS